MQDQAVFCDFQNVVERTRIPHAHEAAQGFRKCAKGNLVFARSSSTFHQLIGSWIDGHFRFHVAVERIHRASVVVVQIDTIFGKLVAVVCLPFGVAVGRGCIPFSGIWSRPHRNGARFIGELPRFLAVATGKQGQRALTRQF
ncbi:MAG: hypothetical protein CMD33_07250 [Flavobacteriales bacterium]|nr:hypothetical protein [Flavobacteriales bacterium]